MHPVKLFQSNNKNYFHNKSLSTAYRNTRKLSFSKPNESNNSLNYNLNKGKIILNYANINNKDLTMNNDLNQTKLNSSKLSAVNKMYKDTLLDLRNYISKLELSEELLFYCISIGKDKSFVDIKYEDKDILNKQILLIDNNRDIVYNYYLNNSKDILEHLQEWNSVYNIEYCSGLIIQWIETYFNNYNDKSLLEKDKDLLVNVNNNEITFNYFINKMTNLIYNNDLKTFINYFIIKYTIWVIYKEKVNKISTKLKNLKKEEFSVIDTNQLNIKKNTVDQNFNSDYILGISKNLDPSNTGLSNIIDMLNNKYSNDNYIYDIKNNTSTNVKNKIKSNKFKKPFDSINNIVYDKTTLIDPINSYNSPKEDPKTYCINLDTLNTVSNKEFVFTSRNKTDNNLNRNLNNYSYAKISSNKINVSVDALEYNKDNLIKINNYKNNKLKSKNKQNKTINCNFNNDLTNINLNSVFKKDDNCLDINLQNKDFNTSISSKNTSYKDDCNNKFNEQNRTTYKPYYKYKYLTNDFLKSNNTNIHVDLIYKEANKLKNINSLKINSNNNLSKDNLKIFNENINKSNKSNNSLTKINNSYPKTNLKELPSIYIKKITNDCINKFNKNKNCESKTSIKKPDKTIIKNDLIKSSNIFKINSKLNKSCNVKIRKRNKNNVNYMPNKSFQISNNCIDNNFQYNIKSNKNNKTLSKFNFCFTILSNKKNEHKINDSNKLLIENTNQELIINKSCKSINEEYVSYYKKNIVDNVQCSYNKNKQTVLDDIKYKPKNNDNNILSKSLKYLNISKNVYIDKKTGSFCSNNNSLSNNDKNNYDNNHYDNNGNKCNENFVKLYYNYENYNGYYSLYNNKNNDLSLKVNNNTLENNDYVNNDSNGIKNKEYDNPLESKNVLLNNKVKNNLNNIYINKNQTINQLADDLNKDINIENEINESKYNINESTKSISNIINNNFNKNIYKKTLNNISEIAKSNKARYINNYYNVLYDNDLNFDNESDFNNEKLIIKNKNTFMNTLRSFNNNPISKCKKMLNLENNNNNNNNNNTFSKYTQKIISNKCLKKMKTGCNCYFKLHNINMYDNISNNNLNYINGNSYVNIDALLEYKNDNLNDIMVNNCFSKCYLNYVEGKNTLKLFNKQTNKFLFIDINCIDKTIITQEVKNVIILNKFKSKFEKDFSNIKFIKYCKYNSEELLTYFLNEYKATDNGIQNKLNIIPNFIEKALNLKIFNLIICLNTGDEIEFVFKTYNDFKIWLNGLGEYINNL